MGDPLNAHPFHPKWKTLSCHGHFSWTASGAAGTWHLEGHTLKISFLC